MEKSQFKSIINSFVNEKNSIKFIANSENLSESKIKKLLISEGIYKTGLSEKIKSLIADGHNQEQIIEYLKISPKTYNVNTPYVKVVYGLEDGASKNALALRAWRKKKDKE